MARVSVYKFIASWVMYVEPRISMLVEAHGTTYPKHCTLAFSSAQLHLRLKDLLLVVICASRLLELIPRNPNSHRSLAR